MKTPILLLNYKAYKESLDKGVKIAKIAGKISKQLRVTIAIAPQYTIMKEVGRYVPVFSQHIEPDEPGKHTGSVLAEEVKKAGAIGSLINHSDKRLPKKEIELRIKKCKALRLISVVCAKNTNEARSLARFKPDFIAVEPPALIGGVISVSTARPALIKNTVDAVKKVSSRTKVLCGAGVHSKIDVQKALELGAAGALVASEIVRAKNKEKEIRNMASGLL